MFGYVELMICPQTRYIVNHIWDIFYSQEILYWDLT